MQRLRKFNAILKDLCTMSRFQSLEILLQEGQMELLKAMSSWHTGTAEVRTCFYRRQGGLFLLAAMSFVPIH